MLKMWEASEDGLVIRWCFFRASEKFSVPAAEIFVVPIGIWLIKFGLIFEVL